MEGEYYALSEAVKELTWLEPIIQEFQMRVNSTIGHPEVYCDNQSTVMFTRNCIENSRSKHIDLRYHFAREKLEQGLFTLKYVATRENLADIFTKQLPKAQFEYLLMHVFNLKGKQNGGVC